MEPASESEEAHWKRALLEGRKGIGGEVAGGCLLSFPPFWGVEGEG